MQPGVSIAAVALRHRLNAKLLLRWVAEQEELGTTVEARELMTVQQAEFIPLQIREPEPAPSILDIQIEVRRGAATVSIRWPGSAAPVRAISKGLLTESALVWCITAKCQDGLPLYRQAALLHRFGGDLSRGTLAVSVVRVRQAVPLLINLLRDQLLDVEVVWR